MTTASRIELFKLVHDRMLKKYPISPSYPECTIIKMALEALADIAEVTLKP